MRKFLVLVILFLLFAVTSVTAAEFDFNGTAWDVNGNRLNATNVTVVVKDQTWTTVWTNMTEVNQSGFFNFTLPGGAADGYMYSVSLKHYNLSSGFVDHVSKPLPTFPYMEFSALNNVNFYLKEAATINITAINASSVLGVPSRIQFSYQIKDTSLGYPIAESATGATQVVANVQKDKNYSIMIYPAPNSNVYFVPVTFNWNNFTGASESYPILDNNGASLSSYNVTTKTVHKMFNVTEEQGRLTGFITNADVSGWDELNIVPFLIEPGNMISEAYGMLQSNVSNWWNQADTFDKETGYYNITLPFARAESVSYMLFAAGRNNTRYGSYRNITLPGITTLNFSMYQLLGTNNTINQSEAIGSASTITNTKKQTLNFINASGAKITNLNAHIELTLDYSDYNATEFTFMIDLSESNMGNISLPMLAMLGYKELQIYSNSYAPKRLGVQTASDLNLNNNITLTTFNPQAIDNSIDSSDITIALYYSNSSCDVPSPPSGCMVASLATMDSFNPFSNIVGGGALSFRMGSGGVLIHYVNVDLLASGPPDGLFEQDSSGTASDSSFTKALKFGSQGPRIYDYVLVSIPYSDSAGSGVDESKPVTMSIPTLYHDNWSVMWDTSINGTDANALGANDSHYAATAADWDVLLSPTTCTEDADTLSKTTPCYIDEVNNRIWIRLPHFSGTSPSITASVAPASTTSATTSTSTTSSTPGASTSTANDVTLNQENLFNVGDIFQTSVGDEAYKFKLSNIDGQEILLYVYDWQTAIAISEGATTDLDLDDDGTYDITISCNEINEDSASITVSLYGEQVAEEPKEDFVEGETELTSPLLNQAVENNLPDWLGILIILTILVIGVVIGYFKFHHKK